MYFFRLTSFLNKVNQFRFRIGNCVQNGSAELVEFTFLRGFVEGKQVTIAEPQAMQLTYLNALRAQNVESVRKKENLALIPYLWTLEIVVFGDQVPWTACITSKMTLLVKAWTRLKLAKRKGVLHMLAFFELFLDLKQG